MAKAQAWGTQRKAGRNPVHSTPGLMLYRPRIHSLTKPSPQGAAWLGSSPEGRLPQVNQACICPAPLGGGRGGRLPTGQRSQPFEVGQGVSVSERQGRHWARGPALSQAKPRSWRNSFTCLFFLSFSCSVSRAPELSQTSSAHFKQELGLHLRVCVHAFYHFRRKHFAVREWVISNPCQFASSLPLFITNRKIKAFALH